MKNLFVRRLGMLNFFDMLYIVFIVLLTTMVIQPVTVVEYVLCFVGSILAIGALTTVSVQLEKKYGVAPR